MSLVSILPRELREEIVEYCSLFSFVLEKSGLFLVTKNISKRSRKNLVFFAAREGYLSLLKWCRNNNNYCGHEIVSENAAMGGHLHVLQWLYENKLCYMSIIPSAAAKEGHLHVLKWAKDHGYTSFTPHVCERAAYGGHLEIIKWLWINNCRWTESVSFSAARNGHLDILKWEKDNGCITWNPGLYDSASCGGHLEIIKWLRENGCPWSTWSCSEAIVYDNLHVLQWLVKEGCPWVKDKCLQIAQMYRRDHIIEWINSQ